MSDLVENPEDWFSHNEAHLSLVARNSGFGASGQIEKQRDEINKKNNKEDPKRIYYRLISYELLGRDT